MTVNDLLVQFCRNHDIPLETKCRRCNQMHQAVRYRIVRDYGYVDYGRCSAMTRPGDCFKTFFPLSEAERSALRQLYKDLRGV